MKCSRILAQNAKDFALRFDMLSADATLRVRGEPSYESVGCGLFSLAIIGLFIGLFAQNIVDVLSRATITATTNLDDQPTITTQENITNIRFAIGIDRTTYAEIQGLFDFSLLMMSRVDDNLTAQSVDLVQCTREIWNNYGNNIGHFFDGLDIGEMLCVPNDLETTLFGYQGNIEYNWLRLIVEKCSNEAGESRCQSNNVIQNFFKTIGYVPVRLLFVDSIISPENSVAVTTTLQKDIFLSFSQGLGIRGQISLGKYNVSTDESIWPFSEQVVQTGHFIQDYKTSTVFIAPTAIDFDPLVNVRRNDRFIDVQIQKSTIIYNVQRSYEKIDNLLSYIGGLFSLLFFVIAFIFGSFNEYRYELLAASPSFTYQGQKKVSEKDMGYGTYFLYSLYDWLKMIGINCNWEKMQRIDEIREEANELLDVANVLQKLRYFDWCISLLMKEEHKIASYLVKPLTISESRKNRKMFEYYNKIMKNKYLSDSDQAQKKISELQKQGRLPVEAIRKFKNHNQPEISRQQQELKSPKDNLYSMGNLKVGHEIPPPKYRKQKQLFQYSKQKQRKGQRMRKKKTKCCQKINQQFDSDDQQAQNMLYYQYLKLQQDSSVTAKRIKQQIPKFLNNCMKNKMVHQNNIGRMD